jgi:hypothetical protein
MGEVAGRLVRGRGRDGRGGRKAWERSWAGWERWQEGLGEVVGRVNPTAVLARDSPYVRVANVGE